MEKLKHPIIDSPSFSFLFLPPPNGAGEGEKELEFGTQNKKMEGKRKSFRYFLFLLSSPKSQTQHEDQTSPFLLHLFWVFIEEPFFLINA